MKDSETNRRAVLQTAAWSIPVLAVAVATPLASASQAAPTIAASKSAVAFGEEVIVFMFVPEGYSGDRLEVRLSTLDNHARIHTVSSDWPRYYPDTDWLQVYSSPDTVAAGTYAFTINFSYYDAPSANYRVRLVTSQLEVLSETRIAIN